MHYPRDRSSAKISLRRCPFRWCSSSPVHPRTLLPRQRQGLCQFPADEIKIQGAQLVPFRIVGIGGFDRDESEVVQHFHNVGQDKASIRSATPGHNSRRGGRLRIRSSLPWTSIFTRSGGVRSPDSNNSSNVCRGRVVFSGKSAEASTARTVELTPSGVMATVTVPELSPKAMRLTWKRGCAASASCSPSR